MIKKYNQFINEELSPELLKKASVSAYNRNQEARGNKFYKAASDTEMSQRNSKKKSNYNEFMSLTNGLLFGYECSVDELRVNPLGDTWIDITGDFKTKKGETNRIIITDDLINEDKVLIVGSHRLPRTEQTIDLKELILDRKDAKVYSNFLNWWKGEQKPFSVDDYCIRGIHL
jgi:hypothetical protein